MVLGAEESGFELPCHVEPIAICLQQRRARNGRIKRSQRPQNARIEALQNHAAGEIVPVNAFENQPGKQLRIGCEVRIIGKDLGFKVELNCAGPRVVPAAQLEDFIERWNTSPGNSDLFWKRRVWSGP